MLAGAERGRTLTDCIEAGHVVAETSGAALLRPEHLLVAILDDPDLDHLLQDVLLDPRSMREDLDERIEAIRRTDVNAYGGPVFGFAYSRAMPDATGEILAHARHLAAQGRFPEPSGLHIFRAITATNVDAASLLRRYGATPQRIEAYLEGEDPDRVRPASDLDRLAQELAAAAQSSPEFEVVDDRLRYVQRPPKQVLFERRRTVVEYLQELEDCLAPQSNALAHLQRAVAGYRRSLGRMGRGDGALRLFIDGAAIETAAQCPDPDSPPINPDAIVALQSFFIAHAHLMSLFPDVARSMNALADFNSDAEAIRNLRSQVLGPCLDRMAQAPGIFDRETETLTCDVRHEVKRGDLPTRDKAVSGLGLAWLRGALATMGQQVLKGLKAMPEESGKAVAQALVARGDVLLGAIVTFLAQAARELVALAAAQPQAFSWLSHLLGLLRLRP